MTETFGEYVRQIRLDKNLSLADVEDRSLRSISRGYVNQIENGQIAPRVISLEKMKALANGLGVVVDELIGKAFDNKAVSRSRGEILMEAFGGQDLSAEDIAEIEATVEFIIRQRQAIRHDEMTRKAYDEHFADEEILVDPEVANMIEANEDF